MSTALNLYRRILRLHRWKLPQEMRHLGDSYVKEEFRLHRTANATQVHHSSGRHPLLCFFLLIRVLILSQIISQIVPFNATHLHQPLPIAPTLDRQLTAAPSNYSSTREIER